MQRRDFIKLAAACGLGVVAAPARSLPTKDSIFRASALYDGPLFVMVHAGGGWDPTSLCDPKGTLPEEVGVEGVNPMNRAFLASEIRQAGNIRYAPVGDNQAFFEKYASELLVINGIDTSTNGHDTGTRHVWSGKLAEGYPSFSALVAGVKSRTSPMAFLSNGGYDFTAGLVAPTRSSAAGPLTRLAFPNRSNPTDANSTFHADHTEERLRSAQRARLNRLRQKESLPAYQDSYGLLFSARAGESEVRSLTDHLPTQLENNGIRRQAQMAIAAYKAGLTVAVNITVGGFDTHGNHDASHIPALGRMLDGVDFLMEEATRQGVRDKLVVVMGSDFGRTPRYNDGNGKDHWSITSMMAMGRGIRGNRVIGETTHGHRALRVDRSSLAVSESGITLRPDHVHHALRRLAGIDGDEIVTRNFPLATDTLELFS